MELLHYSVHSEFRQACTIHITNNMYSITFCSVILAIVTTYTATIAEHNVIVYMYMYI